MSGSSSEEEKDNIPDVKVCELRCKEFADLTSTDTACAQFFLQDTEWDVNRAINAYFDSVAAETAPKPPSKVLVATTLIDIAASPSRSLAFGDNGRQVQQTALPQLTSDKTFRFMTWNVDGLGENSRKLRIERVCKIINCELPTVVHLQEVTPEVFASMKTKLSAGYTLIAGNDNPEDDQYYTVTLLKKDAVKYESQKIIEFPGSSMGRTLLLVKARVSEVPFMFLNSHLESTAEFSNERKRQLSTAFKRILKCDATTTVILAGDLNLRDKELDAMGGLPVGIEDLWITSGRRDELKFTWDAQRNTNILIPGGRWARCRFDRAYMRQASPSRLAVKHFGFVGLEKITECGRFPSDHWGIVAHFDIL